MARFGVCERPEREILVSVQIKINVWYHVSTSNFVPQ